jgi:hypothetical protein
VVDESSTPGGSRKAQVIKTEEKGSDVNLASYMLLDGFNRITTQPS